MELSEETTAGNAPGRKTCVRAGSRWSHVHVRTIEDVERVCYENGIPQDLARDALDLDELARIEHHPSGAVLVVLRAPVGRRERGDQVRTAALSVVILPEHVVTMAVPELAIEASPGCSSPLSVLAALLLRIAERFIEELRAIDASVSALETELQASLRNAELRGLLLHQKTLVHFRTAIASNMILLDRLAKDARFRAERDAELLEDAMVEMRQAAEMTKVSSDILGEMMDAFASIISNNLNVVMKVMTALTIMIALPSFVAALYGMNVALPGQHARSAFAVIASSSVVGVGLLAVLFRKVRWL